jgi:hypothetical protein
MLTCGFRARFSGVASGVVLMMATTAQAQITPAAGYTPPDDTPAIRIGATLYFDYTFQQTPKVKDADGNDIHPNQFNLGRSYINITGNINHNIAFRITPDITRETDPGSTIDGSYVFRVKYAYGQFNLDDWLNKGRTGSWVRLGVQQTPFVDFMENIYRYRFQGTIFEEREGYLSSSDTGASFHYNFNNNYGDFHFGAYNGETYTKPEVNDQKGYQIRGSFRPLPGSALLRGLRIHGFYDADAYVKNADRNRGIFFLTYEHKYVNAGYDYLSTKDQNASATKTPVDGHGYTFWITPKWTRTAPLGPSGAAPIGELGRLEGLFRFDHLEPNKNVSGTRNRTIGGVAYWFPHQGNVSTALLFDVEQVDSNDFTPAVPKQRRIFLHGLVNF